MRTRATADLRRPTPHTKTCFTGGAASVGIRGAVSVDWSDMLFSIANRKSQIANILLLGQFHFFGLLRRMRMVCLPVDLQLAQDVPAQLVLGQHPTDRQFDDLLRVKLV